MSKTEKTYVIAYDISSNKRRRKVVNEILRHGGRVNLSVFECILSSQQKAVLVDALVKIIDPKKDRIAIYGLCDDCMTHRMLIPKRKLKPMGAVVVV